MRFIYVMDRRRVLAQIFKTMRRNDLTPDDVSAYFNSHSKTKEEIEIELMRFDLLCEISGRRERLPFFMGKDFTLIGIFPFEYEDIYLELKEMPYTNRVNVEENYLPEYDWWAKIFPLRRNLNKCLTVLGKPILEGDYFAKHNQMPTKNWIVKFNDNPNGLQGNYYGKMEQAKVRYVGTWVYKSDFVYGYKKN